MIDAVGLIQDLRALLDGCSVVEGLDKAVEYRSNTSRREATVEAVDKIVQRVDDAYRRQALISSLTGTYLVHSQTNAMGASDISVEADTNIRMGLDSQGDSWAYKIDSGVERYTYYGEFGERVARLREEILKGNLDPVLGLNPTLILHGISGLRGELLPALGWDPMKGETYTRFANDPYLKTMRDLVVADERSARSRVRAIEESIIAFQNLAKTLLPETNNPYTNAIVTNDYRVYPLGLFLEDLSKSGNKPEAKPTSEAGNRMGKQLTHAEDDSVTERKMSKERTIRAAKPDTPEIPRGIPVYGTRIVDPRIPMGIPVHSGIGIVAYPLNNEIISDMGFGKRNTRDTNNRDTQELNR